MRIFVDGYNLIFAAARRKEGFDIRQTEAARDHLLALLAKFKSVRSDKLLVFFDGGVESAHLPRRQFQRGLDVLFSDHGTKADDDIKRAVSHDDNPRDIRVVTSDRAIQVFVKAYGAQVAESADFLDEVEAALSDEDLPKDEPIEKFEGPAGEDVEFWLKVFGDDERKDSTC